jgi:hypothetical protein
LTCCFSALTLGHEYAKDDLVSNHKPCDVHMHGGN